MTKKRKTIAALVEDAAALMQKIVKLKALDENGNAPCVTCGKVLPLNQLQGGHFISRKHVIHKLLEENIHPQCAYCNGRLRGNYIPYTLYMEDMYGREFVEELHRTKLHIKKYNRVEIETIIEELKERVGELLCESTL